MKSVLYVCVKNPFSERDMQRMGIITLERDFEVRILDCTAWLMPAALKTRGAATIKRHNLYFVRSLLDLMKKVNARTDGYVLDYVGLFSIRSVLLFQVLKSKGLKLIVVDSGAYPAPDAAKVPSSYLEKLVVAYRSGGLWQLFSGKISNWMLKFMPDQTPDFALVAGTSWHTNPRIYGAKKKIPAHSFDYETYRDLRGGGRSHRPEYLVYLDETIAGHEDNKELGLAEPATPERFYPALNKFFDTVEARFGLRVVVAGYPSTKAVELRQYFGGRDVVFGETATLIRDAKLVLAHASTAISYAVLWRKPIVFLTSDEIASSWYQSWVEAPRAILRSNLVNIDAVPSCMAQGDERIQSWTRIDVDAYEGYENCFIRSVSAPDISLWKIMANVKAA